MKKLICVLLSLVLALGVLAACDSEPVEIGNKPGSQSGKITAKTGGYVFTPETGGQGVVEIAMDAPMAPVLAALGSAKSYFEETSCAFDGKDKHYDYGNFEILTYPAADGDRIQAVYLMNDLVTTKEGLHIGSSKADMERLYGTGYTVSGTQYTYDKGGMKLQILVDDGKVTYITYASTVLGTVTQ